MRQGKLEQALGIYLEQLKTDPESVAANNAAGIVLDLMGRGVDARRRFETAIQAAGTPQAKAAARRAMAMSWAFEADCGNTVRYEQQVFDYWASVKNAYQQGETADEAARVCIDSGDLDMAEKYYRIGHDAGLSEPGIQPDRIALWSFRWEHAQARIAVRRGNKAEADKHIAAAQALLDRNPDMAKAQAIFLPYLTGYVAFYSGDYKSALADLEKANRNDPFILCLMGQASEKLADREKAIDYYRKAASATAHNPPAAYARPFATRRLAVLK